MSTKKDSTYYIDHKGAGIKLGALLFDFLSSCDLSFRELVFICIGSDRITGDSLGPLVGHSLSKHGLSFAYVYGTLSQPVHALNLSETIEEIKLRHPDSLLIAVDASLGTRKHTGYLTISKGSLEPGLGVHKKLPPVGDIAITGIVNSAGNFDHLAFRLPGFPLLCVWPMPLSLGSSWPTAAISMVPDTVSRSRKKGA